MPAGGTGRIGVATVPAGRECCESHPDGKHRPAPLVRSTGQTKNTENCQGKRAVLKVSLFARYCGETEAGKLNKPGLPNAEGLLVGYGDRTAFSMDVTNGVFEALFDPLHPHVGPAEFDDRFPAAWKVKFSLAKGNAIYGTSDTVMPLSTALPIALYLGRSAQI